VTASKSLLDPLRIRVRRLQFTVGLGFLALILGSVVSVALAQRLAGRVQALPFEGLRFAISLGVQKLWVLAALPVLCYGAARIIDLRPLSTALGAALSGQVFILALEFIQDGVEGWVDRGWGLMGLDLVVWVGGVWLSHFAVGRGRAAAQKQQALVQQRAVVRKDEYAEFLREAERASDKSAQRAEVAAPVEVQPSAPGSPSEAPASPEASTPSEPTPAGTDATPKTPAA
jgi:hypothetical protein